MAIIDDTAPPEPKGQPLIVQIAALTGLTVAAIAIGWLAGLYLSGQQPDRQKEAESAVVKASETHLAEVGEKLGVVYLEPVTTNLAGPTETWVRLELALVFADKPDLVVAQTVQQDILAYLRTVKFHQVEGPSGFQHLKSDIEERAAIRSEGKVRSVLIRTLLFE
ncbi:MAG: flagellar basal body-associated FliL family protein [Aquamicrobium sp.]|uniref:flagellar basal body-associated FliL family protein n=1 Tax=Aquamicrobium sp. TaxID=1872579 RepID=UPI00349EFD86|nr:flagellar basal body-associated FliL family protein [Aquamicrobium sp.]